METIKRKLQTLGGSLFLSLPQEWAKRFRLKKGSEVNIAADSSGALRISPEMFKEEAKQSAVIMNNRHVMRDILVEYLKGTEIIRVKGSQPFSALERKNIAKAASMLMNTEIIEETSDTITIQNFRVTDMPLEKMVDRLYYLVRSMLSDMQEAKGDISEVLHERDKLVGRFYFAIIMQIRGLLSGRFGTSISPIDAYTYRLLAERLERIGDEAKALAKDMKGISREQVKMLIEKYDKAYRAFMDDNLDAAKEFWDEEKKIKESLKNQNMKAIYDNIKDMADLIT